LIVGFVDGEVFMIGRRTGQETCPYDNIVIITKIARL
jgi:hypothetical protein